jgi:hypothetical protein
MNLAKNKFVNLGIIQTLGLQIRAGGGDADAIYRFLRYSKF